MTEEQKLQRREQMRVRARKIARAAWIEKGWKRPETYTDINARLAARLRTRLGKAIQRGTKTGSAVRDLGCSITEFKFYLEGKFQDGMTWDNWRKEGWHIDHIVPLSFFDLTKREQFLKACHYTNLQPLWAKENRIKGMRTTQQPIADFSSAHNINA